MKKIFLLCGIVLCIGVSSSVFAASKKTLPCRMYGQEFLNAGVGNERGASREACAAIAQKKQQKEAEKQYQAEKARVDAYNKKVDAFNALDEETRKATMFVYNAGISKVAPIDTDVYEKMSRRQAALFFKRLFDENQIEAIRPSGKSQECNFTDIGSFDLNTQQEIKDSCYLGLFKGTNGVFRPYDPITKNDAVIVAARFLFHDSTIQVDEAYKDMMEINLIKKDESQTGKYAIMRKDIYVLLYRVVLFLAQVQESNTNTTTDLYGIPNKRNTTNSPSETQQKNTTTSNVTGDTGVAQVQQATIPMLSGVVVNAVSAWGGKVSQHFDKNSMKRSTDPDGMSWLGGDAETALQYCQKFFPQTTSVMPIGNVNITDWKNAGNEGSYIAERQGFACVE